MSDSKSNDDVSNKVTRTIFIMLTRRWNSELVSANFSDQITIAKVDIYD